MFNVVTRTDVPGFRVRPVKDPPGFDIDENGLPRRSLVGTFGRPPPNVGSYEGDAMINVVPRTSVPGFRVGLVDDTPGFHVDDNAPRSRTGVQPDPDSVSPFGYGPYGGEQRASVEVSEITPTALFRNTVGGLLPLHFDQRGLMAARGSQDFFGRQLSMMNADRVSKHDQCVERCYPILLRPKPYPGSDLNQWDYLKCYNKCMSE